PVSRPSTGRAVDQDEEPTIGPSSLTLETLREQLSFDDVVRRKERPLDDGERLLFEESDTNQGREDAPTERGTVSQGAAGSFEVESRSVSATHRTREKAEGGPVLRPRTIRGEHSTLVPPDQQDSWVNEADTSEGDEPDTWNPRADVEPGVDWGARPAWSGETEPGQPTDPETLIAHRSPELDKALNPSDFSNYVDEDEVDTREHAAALWEQRVQEEEDADDPATAWRPSVSNKEGIRVFDDPTFDAGVDVGFDDGEVGDDSTVDLLTGAVQIPEDLLDDDSVDVTPDLPPLSARDFGTPPPSNDRTLEAPNPLPDLPPRDVGRPPAPSLPSFPSELETPPGMQEPRGTLVPEGIDEANPAFGPPPGVFTPEPTATLGPGPGDPLQRVPPGLSRDDILRGGIVSDDLHDEEPSSQMSWRVVFAVVAVAGFVGAIGIVGALVYIAQQPAVADFARGLFSGDEVEDAPLVDVVDPDDALEAEPDVVEAEPEAVEEPEVDPLEELAAIQAEAEVRTEIDPSETFAAVRALEPEPAPVPVPAPEPTPPPTPEPPPLIPSRIDEADTRAIDPVPEPSDDKERRKRRRDREPEPAPDPARVAFELPPAPPPSTEPPPGSKIAPADMNRWSRSAFDGQLTGGPAQRLAEVEIDDPQFTRARTLLYLNAKKRGQVEERRGHLGLLMTKPENKYSPVLLVEHAQDAMEQKQYGKALERAKVAEQHWARMPPALVFTRKALIYEIEALAHTGLFYESEGRDLNELRGAIRGWERFQRHVSTKGRDDMAARAEQQLERLRQLEERLQ
ncbi:MAG: hypothetical protein AAF211_13715, partial [Myxococcota bacterium]